MHRWREEAQEESFFFSELAHRMLPDEHRDWCLRQAVEFGSTLTYHEQPTRSYLSFLPDGLKAAADLEGEELPGYSDRARVRGALADKIEREVLPLGNIPRWLERYPMRLRLARQGGAYGVVIETGQRVIYWDYKAGLSRLCPDDAREEQMRLCRRYEPPIREWTERSAAHRVTYMVLTLRNSAPGQLGEGMDSAWKRFKRVMLDSGDFPSVKGALCVLEAPLGSARDWNVHLNVLLLHDGFVDWGKVRRLWHWNVHMAMLPRDPGAIGSALRELIKYAAQHTATKSAEKFYGSDTTRNKVSNTGRDGSLAAEPRVVSQHRDPGDLSRAPTDGAMGPDDVGGPSDPEGRRGKAPPMDQWTGGELLEWIVAHHRRRRTRSYGVLYQLELPEPEDRGPIAWLGRIFWQAGRYMQRLALLDSIPGDKSVEPDPVKRWEALRRKVIPPPIPECFRRTEPVPRLTQVFESVP